MGSAITVIDIEVSKATLNAGPIRPDGATAATAVANDPAGFAALRGWAARPAGGRPIHVAMEATGGCEEAVATHLHAAGRTVSVINPTRVKYAGLMRGRRNKTDPADARLIAVDTRREAPPAWHPPAPEVRELQALARRRDDLRRLAAQEKGRLDAPTLTPAARQSVARVVQLLAKEAARKKKHSDARIAAAPALAADRDLLVSIPGVGPQTASTVLAELPPRRPGADRPIGRRLRRPRPPRVPERHQCPQEAPAVEGRERPAPHRPVPADPHGDPVQPRPSRVLCATRRDEGQAEDAGGRGVYAEARHALLRRPQKSHPVRPRLEVKKVTSTTRYLVRRAFARRRPRPGAVSHVRSCAAAWTSSGRPTRSTLPDRFLTR